MSMVKIYEGNKILIPLFFRAGLDELSFFKSEFGYSIEHGIRTWDGDKLKKVSENSLNNQTWYFPEIRFFNNNKQFTVTFGERESIIECTVSYNGNKYGLWELLEAINPSEERKAGNSWVSNSDFLTRTICDLAVLIKNYWPQIESPSTELIKEIEINRNKESTPRGGGIEFTPKRG